MKTSQKLSLLICAFAFLSIHAQNTIHIPQDAPTISTAVQMAQSGDTIFLSAATYTDSVHISNKNLVIKGDPAGGSVLSPGANEKSFVLQNADIEFMYLTFDDFQQNTPPPNIAIQANYANVKVNHCEFRNMFSPISLYWGDLTFSNSVISNTRSGTCILQNGGTFLIYNNLMHGLSSTALAINRAHGHFFNNTMVGSTPNNHFGIFINSDSISHIFNNIIDGFGAGIQLFAADSNELAALRIYNNNIYNMIIPYRYEYNENLSLPIYAGALNPTPGTGEVSVPSDFIAPSADNFRLQSTSQCIDGGINAYPFSVQFDLDGNARSVGLHPDIGAYEFLGTVGFDEDLEKSNTDVKIYPIPTKDLVWIEFSDRFSGTIEVLDVSGKVVQRMSVEDATKLNLELPRQEGYYFLRMTSHDLVKVERVLKISNS